MNVGVILERASHERRVALTPSVTRQLVEHGNTVWVEMRAGEGAMFRDDEYIRAGAQIAYSPEEVIHRCELVVKVAVPTIEELAMFPESTTLMAFYHMAVKARQLVERLLERSTTAIGYEVIESDEGRLPVLAAISEIAGQMTIPLAMHLLRSSQGGRGILIGGSPGLAPAHVVILGAGYGGDLRGPDSRGCGCQGHGAGRRHGQAAQTHGALAQCDDGAGGSGFCSRRRGLRRRAHRRGAGGGPQDPPYSDAAHGGENETRFGGD